MVTWGGCDNWGTLPKTNIDPENMVSQKETRLPTPTFQGRTVGSGYGNAIAGLFLNRLLLRFLLKAVRIGLRYPVVLVQIFSNYTLPETNSSHLKMDGWKTILSFWDGLFSGAFAVSFREGRFPFFFSNANV